jgi:hypothetical protein
VVGSPDQALAELAFQQIKRQIDLEGRATVTRVDVQPADLPGLAEKAFEGSSAFFGPSISAMKDQLKPYRAACACDVLLVVAMDRRELMPNSNLRSKGFAWVGFSGFDEGVYRSVAGVNLVLHLVDASTGDVVESERNIPDDGRFSAPVDWHGAIWPREMDTVGQSNWPSLLSAYETDLSRSLRRPLFKLGLKPSCTKYFYDVEQVGTRVTSQYSTMPPPPLVMPDGADPARC